MRRRICGRRERREARERQNRFWFGDQKSKEDAVPSDFGHRAGASAGPMAEKAGKAAA
ncbi:hypothetical protein T260_06195 [Geobacillus thermopakistaniensis]|uniref:Uncharacterized protein n=1 Tax=Geobacillus thermopakistaniensis (strain MAS1) TaxID=1408282 RepID=A0A7U9P6Y2_GEOTM|nr:hypothetical protein GA8_06410 [Geobacillus sp. A8]ESU72850.1 hypothetical protein T260_06195 [Geobacillus sp. MAS1]